MKSEGGGGGWMVVRSSRVLYDVLRTYAFSLSGM